MMDLKKFNIVALVTLVSACGGINSNEAGESAKYADVGQLISEDISETSEALNFHVSESIESTGWRAQDSANAIKKLGGGLIRVNGYMFVRLSAGGSVFPRCESGVGVGFHKGDGDNLWTRIRYGWQKPNPTAAKVFIAKSNTWESAVTKWQQTINNRKGHPYSDQSCVFYGYKN